MYRRLRLAPRFQLLPTLKWAGTFACLLIVAILLLSLWYDFSWSRWDPSIDIQVGRAVVDASYDCGSPPRFQVTRMRAHGFYIDSHTFGYDWQPPSFHIWEDYAPGGVSLRLPLWLVALFGLAATLLLWRLDRRRIPPGHCRKCRYNLTANTTNRCPECGAPFAPAAP